MKQEIWKDIAGYDGIYQISNNGRVRSRDRIVEFGNQKRMVKGIILKIKSHSDKYKLRHHVNK